MIFDSISTNKKAQKSIIAVLNATDNDNAPLIVSIKPNGSGVYELEKVDSNFITSIYGKDSNFVNFIERAVSSNNIPIEGADLEKQLAEAVKNITGEYKAAEKEIAENSQVGEN